MYKMRITEYANDLQYTIPGMVCDDPIRKGIKHPLPDTSFFMGIIGSAGSGKTSLMMSLLTHHDVYHKTFNHIIVVMPKHSRDSIAGNPWENHPEDKLFDELNPKVLEFVHELGRVASPLKQHTLLVLDDCTVQLKDKENERLLKQIIFNRRHLKISIIILVQSYNSIPLSLRKTFSHLAYFKPRNRKETQNIFEELMFYPKDIQEAIHSHVFPEDEPYNFIFLNTGNGKCYKCFNELKIEDE